MNGLATDTCSSMRRPHQIMSAGPRLSHVFMVLGDSHGLRLLMDAIISKHKGISYTMEKAQGLVAAFAHWKVTACHSSKASNGLLWAASRRAAAASRTAPSPKTSGAVPSSRSGAAGASGKAEAEGGRTSPAEKAEREEGRASPADSSRKGEGSKRQSNKSNRRAQQKARSVSIYGSLTRTFGK